MRGGALQSVPGQLCQQRVVRAHYRDSWGHFGGAMHTPGLFLLLGLPPVPRAGIAGGWQGTRGRTQGAQKRGRKGEEQTFTSRMNAGVVKGAVFLAVLFEGQMEERLQTPSTAVQRPWKPA